MPYPSRFVESYVSVPERRTIVADPSNADRSNLSLAEELGVSQETIRRDRLWLKAHPGKVPVSRKFVPEPPPENPAPYEIQTLDRHIRRIEKQALAWFKSEALTSQEFDQIAPRAYQLLGLNHEYFRLPMQRPKLSPENALLATRPKELNNDSLALYPDWLAAWLQACLPADMDAQKRVFEGLWEIANSRKPPRR